MLQAIGELEPRFRKSGQQQLLVETLLVRFALLDRTVELEDVLRSIGGGGGSGGGSAAVVIERGRDQRRTDAATEARVDAAAAPAPSAPSSARSVSSPPPPRRAPVRDGAAARAELADAAPVESAAALELVAVAGADGTWPAWRRSS